MKKSILVLTTLFAVCMHAQEAEALFDAKCAACHMKERPTQEMKKDLVAPPISGAIKNVKLAFKDDKAAALTFIREYTLSPDIEKSKCKPKALKRFGVMPTQKGSVSAQELDKIALFLYENYPLPKKDKKDKKKQ